MLHYTSVRSGARPHVRAAGALVAAAVLMAGFSPLAQRAALAAEPGDTGDTPPRPFAVAAVNASHDGSDPNGPSEEAVVSDDGRFVVFVSHADSLFPGQPPSDSEQLLRRDLDTGAVELVTTTHDGRVSTSGGDLASVSADGRYVAFESASADLVPHDYYDGNSHLFLRDMELDTTVRVGRRGLYPKISDDGATLLFENDGEHSHHLEVLRAGDEDGVADDVLWESDSTGAVLGTRTTVAGTVDAWMWNHNLSGDGNVVAWHEGWWDPATRAQTWRLKVRDMRGDPAVPAEDLGALVAPLNMNNPPDNMWPPALSEDGRYVGYHVIELTRDLVYLRDRTKDEPELLVESSYADRIDYVELSDDARHVVYSVTEPGPEELEDGYDGWHWWDGEGLALPLRMTGMCYYNDRDQVATQLYRLDRQTGATQHVTATPDGGKAGHSCAPDLSGDGKTVVFQSYAADLVAGETEPGPDLDWDVFAATLPAATSPPSWPAAAALRAEEVSATTVRLGWDAATTHGAALSAYRVYRGAEQVAEVAGGADRSALVGGLSPSTAYAFGVEAVDALGASSPRLTVQATTAAGVTPGTAPLLASVARGGTVTLSWDPFEGATGYRVMRARGTGALAQVAQLPATELRYVDAALPADTDYRYLVQAVVGDQATPHTVERSVEIGPVVADALTATVPRAGGSGTAVLGTHVALTLHGDPGRRAEATIAFDDWLGEGDAERPAPAREEAVVALTEKTPGVYTGTFPVRTGIAALHSVTGRLSDEHSSTSTPVAATGFPLAVSGALHVSIDAPADSLPNARLLAWSTTRRSGAHHPVSGGGDVRLAVPAADDYVVRLQRSDGRDAAQAQLPVRAGMVSQQDLVAALPAQLDVRLLGPDGGALDAAVTVEGAGPPLAATASTSAPARLSALDAGATVRITAAHREASSYLQRAVTVTRTLTPGLNEVDIDAVALPRGTVTGRITGDDGLLTRARIVATQQVDGLDRSFTTTTDEAGHYALDLLSGPARLEVTSTGYRAKAADVSVVEGQSTTADVELSAARSYQVAVRLLTKYVGDSDFIEQDIDWPVAIHFALAVRTTGGQHISRATNPTTVVGAPGEQVNVCASGRKAGLPDSCATVTLPPVAAGEVGHAAAELRLVEAGVLRTSLLDPSGAAHEGWWQGSLLRAGSDGSRTFVRAVSGIGAPRVAVPSAGTYVLELSASSNRWRSPVVEVPDGSEVVVDPLRARTGGPFTGDGNSVDVARTTALPDGTVEVRTAFGSSATIPLSGAVARLEVPGGTTLVEGSVLRDGHPVDGVVRDGVLEVPLGTLAPGATGVLRHQVRLDEVEPGSTVAFHSFLRTSDSSSDGHELGSAQVVVAGVTLSAPRRVPSAEVPVSGRAPAGASVGIYSEGVLLGRVQATPGGFWSTSVTLPDRGELHTHVLSAAVEVGDRSLRSDTEPVTVDSDHLVATQVSVQQTNGRRITFDPRHGIARFPYVYVPGNAMVVEATFAEPERVENVRVRIGTREAPATFVDGVFRATVDADGRGGIYVDYDVVAKPARADAPPDAPLSEAQLRERMPAPLRDFQLRGEPTYSSEGGVDRGTYTLDLPSLDTSLTSTLEVEKDQTYTVTAQDVEDQRRSGSPFYGLQITEQRRGDEMVVTLSGHVPQDQLVDDTGVVEAAMGLLQRTFGGDDEQSSSASTAAAGAAVNTARIGYQVAFNYVTNGDSLYQAVTAGGKYEEIERMYSALDSSGCDHEVKEGYRALADSAAKRAMLVDFLNIVMTGVGYALAPATFGMGTVAMWGVSWVAGKAMDFALGAQIERSSHLIADAVAFCRRDGREDLPLDDPRPPNADPVWIFDPSGFVYEAVPSNRLSGVTATVFQQDEQAGSWAAWDAEWFGQDNPQVTGADGRYAWDVPAGLWQVVYEKEGYARAQSAELRVLPPHVDVNVGLVSLAAPQVEAMHATAGGPVEISFDRYMQPETVVAAVQVRRGGDVLDGTLAPVDAEASPAGPTYARTFRFSPTAPLVEGEVLRVSVDELAENYAQRTLAGDVERDVTVAAAPTVPAAPRTVSATPGNATATLSWQAPESDGGSAVTGYTVTSEPATTTLSLPASATGTTVSGLTNGTAYRFTVAAVNAIGTGPGATTGWVTPTSGGGGDGGQPTSPPTSPPPPLPSPSTPPASPAPTAPAPTSPAPTSPAPTSPTTGSSSDGLPSAADPVVVRVTSPRGGPITFAPGSGRSPRGFVAAGSPWVIEAPDATAEDPLELVFRVDASVLRTGIPVGVFRDGALVTGCTSQTAAEPDPCLLRSTVVGDGDVVLVVLSSHASTWQVAQPEAGSVDGACAPNLPDPFGDTRGSVHRVAIACLAGHGITTGTSPTTFAPAGQVTRAQMASFVARLLDRAGVELPAAPDGGFVDVPAGAVHATAIGQLAELGVVRGFGGGTYRPADVVSRAQMASFLTRAYDLTTEVDLPTSQPFDDVAGDTHERAIGTIAALGITEGVTPTSYVPGTPVTREQMASFLARTLNLLVVAGVAAG